MSSRRTTRLAVIGFLVWTAVVVAAAVAACSTAVDHRVEGVVIVSVGFGFGLVLAWYWWRGPGRGQRTRWSVGGVLGVTIVSLGAMARQHWFVAAVVEAGLVGLAGAPLVVWLWQIGVALRERTAHRV